MAVTQSLSHSRLPYPPQNRTQFPNLTRSKLPKPITITITITMSTSSQPPTTTTTEKKKVVVCGGGIIGVCTAYFLSKSGASVTLIEQSSIASAASGKAGGFLALDWSDGCPTSSLSRHSFLLHRQLSHLLDGPTSYGYRPLTTLSLTLHEPGPTEPVGFGSTGPVGPGSVMPGSVGTGSTEPVPVGSGSVGPVEPGSGRSGSGGRGMPGWVDGQARDVKKIGTAQTTAQVHPGMFTRKLMREAEEKYEAKVVVGKVVGVGVVGSGSGEGRVDSVVLEDGRVIEGDAVVLALGPWSSTMEVVSSLFRVYGLKAHSIVLEPKVGGVVSAHALFLSYYRSDGGRPIDPEVYPRPNGEVYICGMSSTEEVPDKAEDVLPNPESIKVLKQVAENVSSHLKEGEAQVKAEQACFLPCTDDGNPVIGELPGTKGCFVATGHSCWGILNGPATGAALAELILHGQTSIVDLSAFSPSRFLTTRKRR